MSAAATPRRHRTCPTCHGSLRQVHRQAQDDAATPKPGMRHFRCRSTDCGWEGLLARAPRPHGSSRRAARASRSAGAADERAARVRVSRIATALLLLVTVAVAGTIVWVRQLPLPFIGGGRVIALGESYFGDPLPTGNPLLTWAASPAAAPALQLRQGCAWGEPGRNPYRGSIDQALSALRLPPRVSARLAARIRSRRTSDRVEIRNESIQASVGLQQFDPQRIAMTFGETLCIGTQVHFHPGHVEWADLYEIDDIGGRRYAVMVADVCGNISLLHASGQKGDGDSDATALATRGWDDFDDAGFRLDVETADEIARANAGRELPEPGTLACTLGALAALGLACGSSLRRRYTTVGVAAPSAEITAPLK